MDSRSALLEPTHRPAWNPWSDANRLEAPVEAIGFWTSIAFPVVYLTLLGIGVESRSDLYLFLALVGLHLISLVIGRNHRRNPGR